MPNVINSPNMNLPVPVVSVDPGPDWATNLNSCLQDIDQHTHASGSGVQVTPSGLNINADLPFGNNNAITLRSVRFTAQSTTLNPAGTDVGCLYVSGVDLYFNDLNGNPAIQVTASGAVNAGPGSISGLPSGTAGASYSVIGGHGTFSFTSATNTPAYLNVGPIVLGQNTTGKPNITIQQNSSQSGNFNFIFPSALPGSANYTTLDSSGNLAYNSSGSSGTGAVVLATSPTVTSGTLAGTTGTLGGTIVGGAQTFTGITTTPVAFSGNWILANTSMIMEFCIQNTTSLNAGIFTIHAINQSSPNLFYILVVTSGVSVSLSGGVATITGLGDGNTYTLSLSPSAPATIANNTFHSNVASSGPNISLKAQVRAF